MRTRIVSSAVAIASALFFASGCGDDGNTLGEGGGGNGGGPGPTCVASAATEAACSDGKDDDCDGYPDCLDPDCDGQTCGSGGEYTCTAGACLAPIAGCELPELPRIDNVQVTMHGTTAKLAFEPVAGAKDYRVYARPTENCNISVGTAGELSVANAVYRCGGDIPGVWRHEPGSTDFGTDLSGDAFGYARSESESVLGYVYLTPGVDRDPVYRVSNPDASGGLSIDWQSYVAPLWHEWNPGDYVIGTDARDALVQQGWRDDGVAFYAPKNGTLAVYRLRYETEDCQQCFDGTVFYTDGPERAARADATGTDGPEAQRFSVFPDQQPGTVALHRVLYSAGGEWHDVLAAGEARFERVLRQGVAPTWELTVAGVTTPTTFVIEALDQGCPFPGGYVSATHSEAAFPPDDHPSLTLDEARLSSGEVFVNGQHDLTNRPKPLARAYVDVTPAAAADYDWYDTFDPDQPWQELTQVTLGDPNAGQYSYTNDRIQAFSGGCVNFTLGPVLGQMVMGGADGGSACGFYVGPATQNVSLSSSSYVHVHSMTAVPSTLRRYPQVLITNADSPLDLGPVQVMLEGDDGIVGTADDTLGEHSSIVVQPFGGSPELQVEFCDRRGWAVSAQCPRANIYGFHAGSYFDEWNGDDPAWTPVPVLGPSSGFDQSVTFDVYASTSRVYVFIDDRPAGCAALPSPGMPAGPVKIMLGAVAYHLGADMESQPNATDADGVDYWSRFSRSHTHHHFDDFGIKSGVAAPAWDEKALPCGTRYYGGT